MKIELLRTRIGIGEQGAVLEVSEDRADRWCRDGIAKLYEAEAPPEATEPEAPAEAPKHAKSKRR